MFRFDYLIDLTDMTNKLFQQILYINLNKLYAGI